MSKVLIIGGVAGGASCAARLRRLDDKAEIILFERGEHISYANCGLPYFVGGTIKSKNALILQTPKAMKDRFNIDVRIKQEVVKIDRENKRITVKNLESGEEYQESYDTLVISTGSSPIKPRIEGIDSPNIHTLWTVNDSVKIRDLVTESGVKSAAVIGGGFIGLEMAENLREAGLEVTLIEMLDQVMATLDYEMAQVLHENITQNNVDLILNDGVSSFLDKENGVEITLKSGKKVNSEMVILSIGVKPNGELAKEAGLTVNQRGGIIVDEYLRSSDTNIYAVGDVIEVVDFVNGKPTMIPLAGPANKQGRIAADNIAGGSEKYEGTQGTSIAKVFDMTAASTGSNEKALNALGLVKGKDFETLLIAQNSHAGYYPGATNLYLKLIFSKDGKKIYGSQIVGQDGVDKRIDVIATVIRLGGGIDELKRLELAYAPPYSSAKDPVNMAGFVAENVIEGKVLFSEWDAVEKSKDAIILDVRESPELMAFSVKDATHIPFGEIRNRLDNLDKSKEIIVLCARGIRAYNAARILMLNGFNNVKVYPGGTSFYRSTHYESSITPKESNIEYHDSGMVKNMSASKNEKVVKLDCTGLQCPGPLMRVYETVKGLEEGSVIEVTASDPGFLRDIDAWCKRTGNVLLFKEIKGNEYFAKVSVKKGEVATTTTQPDGKTIIVFSGDLDKVIASFIIANGAAAMGRKVTMFFTFWGLSVLRKPKKQRVKKSFMENMFGIMLPRGSKKLKLSKMN
ncbi:MAG: FAD-dependent oxidoreductase, partial [Clostridiales bacterium]|nr:FAD-dependent oxidoreductase [Clostridiales bacterium]